MKISKLLAIPVLSFLVFLCPATGPLLSAQQGNSEDHWTADVERQLDQLSVALQQKGFRRSKTWVDSIGQGDHQYIEVTLAAHTTYAFARLCDTDCTDLDLYLRDGDGTLIDSDTKSDDTPVVTVTPRYTGTFRVWVEMVRCKSSPCRWGVGLYK